MNLEDLPELIFHCGNQMLSKTVEERLGMKDKTTGSSAWLSGMFRLR